MQENQSQAQPQLDELTKKRLKKSDFYFAGVGGVRGGGGESIQQTQAALCVCVGDLAA